jgi:hypothetical protein
MAEVDAKPEAQLGRVVANAIDFLSQALKEFEGAPKYSVIHFYSALELFVKARLLAEHWTLVVSKRQEPDRDKFLKGDFISVTLDEANDRLTRVLQSGLSPIELQQFRAVGQHRNRMVHFFHEAAGGKPSKELLGAIAKEQVTAWYLLHKILKDRWGKEFKKWTKDLDALNVQMKKHRAYLEVIYTHAKPDLKKIVDAGEKLFKCASCDFPAYLVTYRDHEYSEGDCKVCDLRETAFDTKCPKCGSAVRYVDDGWTTCEGCGKDLGPQELDATLDWGSVSVDKDSLMPAHCTFCDGHQSVNDYHDTTICLNCFRRYEEGVHQCDWCGSSYMGKPIEDSYWFGCPGCSGKAGDLGDE